MTIPQDIIDDAKEAGFDVVITARFTTIIHRHFNGGIYDVTEKVTKFAQLREQREPPLPTCSGEPVAWIEHHKGGDNLNWERVDHGYAKATPLYIHPQVPINRERLAEIVMDKAPEVSCKEEAGYIADVIIAELLYKSYPTKPISGGRWIGK